MLGRINFDVVKEPKGVHLENVKWTSMVNHYEQARPTNKQTRQHFKIYNLDDYTSQLAEKHGLQYDSKVNGISNIYRILQKMLSIINF